MNTVQGSAHYEGLLPVEPPDEPPPLRPATLENNPLPNGQPSLRKRASRTLSRFLIVFCVGVAGTLAWQSYGDAARQMIANSYPLLGWLAPQAKPVAQSAPNMIALAAPATPSSDQQQLGAASLDLDAVRQSIDRIAAGQEQTTRSIDQIAASIAAGQEQTTRSIDQIAASIATGQEQMARSIAQTATSMAQAPLAKASGVTVERRPDGSSLEPTVRLNTKRSEVRPPQTSDYDPSCFPSPLAVLQNHPGGRPSWTLKAPGHEGTKCWYAADRPRVSDHRREIAPPAPNRRAPE